MYYFNSDYTEGCTPEILAVLSATNFEQTGGYGDDHYTKAAASFIKKECGRDDVDVHFMMGGTQTNLTMISAALRPFHGIYATVQSHINTHEAGAIERTGHKVIDLPSTDGKITAAMVEREHQLHLTNPSREHLVQPKMVYISQPTELGTLYHKEELEALYAVCKQYDLYLFIDGARLGYGLAASDNDLSIADITNLCDMFYIGGTKCGAFFGEAAVLVNPVLKADFHTLMKQCGSVLAKGRLLGLQFETLFTDGLYYKICERGTRLAMQIKAAVKERGLELVTDSTTNQLFIIFPLEMYNELSKSYVLSPCENVGTDKIMARICTSWATDGAEVDKLCKIISEI